MKLNSNLNSVERSGLTNNESKKFTIEASAKAFEILSANIYSKPQLAVVRELMCNAYDAHIAADTKDQPIRVTVPNEQTPFFEVYDFGPGMTHDQIMTLYTQFFNSTKDQSNDFVGAMGIGSKAPFAYTTQFAVESRQSGQLHSYSAYITEDGSPEIILVETRATDEPDGLTVRVPVKKQDYQEFKAHIIRTSVGFEPTPEMINLSDVIRPPTILGTYVTPSGAKVYVSGENLGLSNNYYTVTGSTRTEFPHSGYSSIGIDAVVKQGTVIYPMALPIPAGTKGIGRMSTELMGIIVGSNLVIEVPMGTCQIAASRETLRYDKSTTKYLEDVLADFAEHVLASFEPVFNNHTSKLPMELHAQITQATKRWPWLKIDRNECQRTALSKCYAVHSQEICAWYTGSVSIPSKDLVDWTSLTFSGARRKAWDETRPETKVAPQGHSNIIADAERVAKYPNDTWILALNNWDAVVFNDTLLSKKPVMAHMRVRYGAATGAFGNLDLSQLNISYFSPLNAQHPDCKLSKSEIIKKFRLQGCEEKIYFVSDLPDRPRRKIEKDPVTQRPRTVFRDGVYGLDTRGELVKLEDFNLSNNTGRLYLPLVDVKNHEIHPDVNAGYGTAIRDFLGRSYLGQKTVRCPTSPLALIVLVNKEQYTRMNKIQHGLVRADVWIKEQHRKAWEDNKIPMMVLARAVMCRQNSQVLTYLFPEGMGDVPNLGPETLKGLNLALRYALHIAPMPEYKLPSNVQAFFDRAMEFGAAKVIAEETFKCIEIAVTGDNVQRFASMDYLIREVFNEQELAALRKAVRQVIQINEKSYNMLKASKYRFIADGWVSIPTFTEVFTTEWFPSIFNNCKKGT